mgnify:CR=1 FL=1
MSRVVKATEAVAARDLRKTYGAGESQVTALNNASIRVGVSKFLAIMGPSGSGKSTLMQCLAGLDSIDSGNIKIGGIDITSLNDRDLTRLRREHVGFIFQHFNLVSTLTAEQNIMLPMKLAKRQVDQELFNNVVERLGIKSRLSHKPHEMSGGQQQRVAIARALVAQPTVIFADEPTGNLDSVSSSEVLRFLRDSVDVFGQTVIMVTHDPIAATYADETILLADGRITATLVSPTVEQVVAALQEVE